MQKIFDLCEKMVEGISLTVIHYIVMLCATRICFSDRTLFHYQSLICVMFTTNNTVQFFIKMFSQCRKIVHFLAPLTALSSRYRISPLNLHEFNG